MILYFIRRGPDRAKRTRGIRIESSKYKAIGLAFYATGGFEYQECLGNLVIGDGVAYLKKERVS